MICLFSIKYSDSKENLIKKFRAVAAESNGSFSGNTISGSFTGKTFFGTFKGRYTMDGVITVIIDDKPFFIGCEVIEKEIMKYLNGAKHD